MYLTDKNPVPKSGPDRPTLTCPHCLDPWKIGEEVETQLLRELSSWDKRFDSEDSVLSNCFEILAEAFQDHR